MTSKQARKDCGKVARPDPILRACAAASDDAVVVAMVYIDREGELVVNSSSSDLASTLVLLEAGALATKASLMQLLQDEYGLKEDIG